MEFISVKKSLPKEQKITDSGNKYYLVLVDGFGKYFAMYCSGEWYADYISKIFREVTHWMDIEEPTASSNSN